MKRNALSFFIVLTLGAGAIYFTKDSGVSKSETLKDYPQYIQSAFIESNLEVESYRDLIKKMKISKEENSQLGTRLYQEALGNSMYSNEKLKILKMAKAHLLVAKGME